MTDPKHEPVRTGVIISSLCNRHNELLGELSEEKGVHVFNSDALQRVADLVLRAAAAIDKHSRTASTVEALTAQLDALKEENERLKASSPQAEVVGEQHPDDLAVDRFAAVMKVKLAKKRAEGRGGWDNPEECSIAFLSVLLRAHIAKGDPIDVGNFAMMIHQRGGRVE